MRRRLLLTYLGLTLFVLVVLEVPLAIAYARNERQNLTGKVERDAVALSSFAQDVLTGHREEDEAVLRATAQRYDAETRGRVVVVDAEGISLVDTTSPDGQRRDFSTRPEIADALAGQVATGTRRSTTLNETLLYVAVPVASGGEVHGAVRVTYPTSTIDEHIARYWLTLVAIAAVVLVLASLLAIRFARALARPLAGLGAAADLAGAGDLSVRAAEEGPSEVRALAARFNDMVGRLDELVRSQEAFVADASHQLRTPLAALRLRLENLERDVAAEGRDGLERALAEVARLSRLVDGLLALARADAVAPAGGPVDLAALASDRVAFWAALADERGVRLALDAPAAVPARATAGRVVQVLDNLIENALDASPEGSTVTVSAGSAGAWAELHVADEGPGLPPEQRLRAFDRFWRAGSDGEGSGLGLAIVARLVQADGGTVELRASTAGGVDAVVRLAPGPE